MCAIKMARIAVSTWCLYWPPGGTEKLGVSQRRKPGHHCLVGANNCQLPGKPLNSFVPRSEKRSLAPATRSVTTRETRTSPAAHCVITRAARVNPDAGDIALPDFNLARMEARAQLQAQALDCG